MSIFPNNAADLQLALNKDLSRFQLTKSDIIIQKQC